MKKEQFINFTNPILYILLGILLIAAPSGTLKVIAIIIGVILAVLGISNVIAYCSHRTDALAPKNSLVLGIIQIVLSIIIFACMKSVISVMPFILGLLIVINGVREFMDAPDAFQIEKKKGWMVILFAVINVILGIVMMANPFSTAVVLVRAVGIGLCISGVMDLVTSITLPEKK
ncbi:MAG: DUF308 domain-containing protein [Oscillospiraceae bacterium]|jgi:uncharacterized membrane protein HdeD (DUF308 family)|nr:DUF308 domain-containing protein [Oscillospiraceae bacterium]MDD3260392.1 DUF308 domain-containing protein [Oscillospiraceae bacterium]